MAILSIKIRTLDGRLLPVKRTHPQNKVKQVVDQVVNHMSYPLVDDQDKEIEYFLENGQGNHLPPDSTLEQAGVQQDDELTFKSSAKVGEGLDSIPPPEGMINVNVHLLDLSRIEPDTFELDMKVGDVINQIIKKYDLPTRADRRVGEGKLYELLSKTIGSVLHEGMTLRDAKIQNHDTLIISTKETPG
jgi:hypothetical protein